MWDAPGMSDSTLEAAIGREVRSFRTQLGLTIVELAKQAGLSAGMLSKVERGQTPPSLSTIEALAQALNVPVTSLFRSYDQQHDASFVPAGHGLVIERRGTRVGHRYELLGHTVGKRVSVEPYLISLDQRSEVFPLFQHAGVELIHVLEGEMVYRAAGAVYRLRSGDSLMFDANTPHGPEELNVLPIRFLSVITRASDE
jgi:transcriptional regulator with XRE-family HTH domain